jgi:hypothetical protein
MSHSNYTEFAACSTGQISILEMRLKSEGEISHFETIALSWVEFRPVRYAIKFLVNAASTLWNLSYSKHGQSASKFGIAVALSPHRSSLIDQ